MRQTGEGVFKDTILPGALAFLAGMGLVQQLESLPSLWWLAAAPGLIGLAVWQPRLRVAAALGIGVLWALSAAHLRMSHSLPEELVGRDVTVQGTIESIPEPRQRNTRFEFRIDSGPAAMELPLSVRLSWYRSENTPIPELHVGQRWNLRLRLKPPNGLQNPGGFDYETWLFSRGVRATGYVRGEGDNRLLEAVDWRYSLSRLREYLLNELKAVTAGMDYGGILLALALGYRGGITDQQWDLLTGTGTNHLMAISGLHIGLVAGLVFFATMAAIRLWRGRLKFPAGTGPAQRYAAWAAIAGAAAYALLAGFSLPTRRALIMLATAMAAVIALRPLRPAYALALALVAVVAMDPFAVNTPGFWLSFGAVAVLVYAYAGRVPPPRRTGLTALPAWIGTWGRVQWLLVMGLLPLTLFWFGGAAVTAAAANLLAIPLVGFLVVPLTLIATLAVSVWPVGAEWLLQAAHAVLQGLWPVLQHMSQWPLARWEHVPPPLWTLFPAAVGIALLLAPRGFPARWVGVCWLMPALVVAPARPAEGELTLTVLDVGQGTAIVARTAEHVLLYDVGPRSSDYFDTGELVVLPYFKSRGIKKVDTLLVSHGDNDHIGGARAVLDKLPVSSILTSVPGRFDHVETQKTAVERCKAGRHWRWDGVEFRLLHPARPGRWRGNNGSCVLEITVGDSRRVLISGDIEDNAERRLLGRDALQPVDILVAPHHGSRTSSTDAFIQALQPRHTVFTAGLLNRYGFPKPDVAERYRRAGSRLWTSGKRGALSFEVDAEAVTVQPGYRQSAARYWHYRPDLSLP